MNQENICKSCNGTRKILLLENHVDCLDCIELVEKEKKELKNLQGKLKKNSNRLKKSNKSNEFSEEQLIAINTLKNQNDESVKNIFPTSMENASVEELKKELKNIKEREAKLKEKITSSNTMLLGLIGGAILFNYFSREKMIEKKVSTVQRDIFDSVDPQNPNDKK